MKDGREWRNMADEYMPCLRAEWTHGGE